MKKNKLLLLTIIVFMCTGCDIEYNLTIKEDTIEEIIDVNDYITASRKELDIKNHYNMWYPTFINYAPEEMEGAELEDFSIKVDWIEYHQKNINKIENGYNYTYKYTYDIDDYHDAQSIYMTYLKTTALNNNNTLVLRTEKENFLCRYDYFENLKINITIDPNIYELNYTNTENISNNTYTWYLDRNNCNDSEIILTLNKIDKIEEPIDKNINDKKNYTMYIFYGILLLIAIVGYFMFKKMKNKNENFDLDD